MAINPSNPYSLAQQWESLTNPQANTELLRALADRGAAIPTSGGRRAPAPTPAAPAAPETPPAPPATSATSVPEVSTPPLPTAYDRRNYAGQIEVARQRYDENAKAADLALLTGQITPLQRRRVDERYRNELGYLNAMANRQESRDRRINELRAKNAAKKGRKMEKAPMQPVQDTRLDRVVNREMPTMQDILAQSPTGFLMDLASRPEVSTMADRDLYNMNREAAQMPRELLSDRIIREAEALREQNQPVLPEMASYPEGFVGPPETAAGMDTRLYDEAKMERFRQRQAAEDQANQALIAELQAQQAQGAQPRPDLTGTTPGYEETLQRYRNMGITDDQMMRNPEIARKFQMDVDAANARLSGAPTAAAPSQLPQGAPPNAFLELANTVFGPGGVLGTDLPPELAQRAVDMATTQSERNMAEARQATAPMGAALRDLVGGAAAANLGRPRMGQTPTGPTTRDMAREPWAPIRGPLIASELDPGMLQAITGLTPQGRIAHMAETGPVMGNISGRQRQLPPLQGPVFPLPRRTGYITNEQVLSDIFGLTPQDAARMMGQSVPTPGTRPMPQ
jgi:hypothetical protein